MIGKKKKNEEFLYAGLKSRLSQIADVSQKNEKKTQIKRKLVVAITSLKHGAGSSYLSIALANYLTSINKEKVCMLHKGCAYAETILDENVDSIFYPCNMGDIYANYGYIIYDGGVINDADKNMLDRSDIKIMLCWPNDEYIRLLADFTENRDDLDNWIFIFNHVLDKNKKKIYDLMEDYNSCCLPEFDAKYLDKQIKELFGKVF